MGVQQELELLQITTYFPDGCQASINHYHFENAQMPCLETIQKLKASGRERCVITDIQKC